MKLIKGNYEKLLKLNYLINYSKDNDSKHIN
jgi:hypothetical protein